MLHSSASFDVLLDSLLEDETSNYRNDAAYPGKNTIKKEVYMMEPVTPTKEWPEFNSEQKISQEHQCTITGTWRTSHDQERGSNFPTVRWTEYEEIILVGVVTDCNLVSNGKSNWSKVQACYNVAASNFNNLYGTEFVERTTCACRKHYKTMYKRIFINNLKPNFWQQVYVKRWLSKSFNQDQELLSIACILRFNKLT